MAIDPNNRPVRVINDDTTDQELAAGHIIPDADPPKNEAARGGFGNRDGKEGFGTDSGSGNTSISVNEDADKVGHPADNMLTVGEGANEIADQDIPDPDMLDDDDAEPRKRPNPSEANATKAQRTLHGAGESDVDGIRATLTASDHDVSTVRDSAPGEATPETNADLNDPNAQESGILRGE
ncbi:hypothetical protein H8B13_15345 [Hymenobacter sp. BT188]|uniref:hypothetical protein n=1 Tax=Hymenobacter sp. BT188 TaxID=2763504 RepID=UPI0016515731|nr:hypothetical protein [Hymenobacter sp. BT188]MBC6608202.1 hypothetical protein [Hymenobacter sp. BT188]